jgi:hypothetical protein
VQNPKAKQIEIGAAIHDAFENFQAVDLTFNLSITVFEFKGNPNCCIIF